MINGLNNKLLVCHQSRNQNLHANYDLNRQQVKVRYSDVRHAGPTVHKLKWKSEIKLVGGLLAINFFL